MADRVAQMGCLPVILRSSKLATGAVTDPTTETEHSCGWPCLPPVLDSSWLSLQTVGMLCRTQNLGRRHTLSEQNKKTIRMVREQAPRNPAVLDGLYTDDYVYHGIPMIGDLKGPTAFQDLSAGVTGPPLSHLSIPSRR